MRSLLTFVFLIYLIRLNCAARNVFRNDYSYISSTKSFYKIHRSPKTWLEAKRTCESEGASLFHPTNEDEYDVMSDVMDDESFTKVFTGISARTAARVYTTVDGQSLSNIYHSWAPGEPSAHHRQNCVLFRHEGTLITENCDSAFNFICKKSILSSDWDKKCKMPKDKGYKFSEVTGNCYKFHPTPAKWAAAKKKCEQEMSYLAVINSQAEHDMFVTLIRQAHKNAATGPDHFQNDRLLLGFQDLQGKGWTTLQGVPLSKSGFSSWHSSEPNNVGAEKCGSMFFEGGLNDEYCHVQCYYICEHDPDHVTDFTECDDC